MRHGTEKLSQLFDALKWWWRWWSNLPARYRLAKDRYKFVQATKAYIATQSRFHVSLQLVGERTQRPSTRDLWYMYQDAWAYLDGGNLPIAMRTIEEGLEIAGYEQNDKYIIWFSALKAIIGERMREPLE